MRNYRTSYQSDTSGRGKDRQQGRTQQPAAEPTGGTVSPGTTWDGGRPGKPRFAGPFFFSPPAARMPPRFYGATARGPSDRIPQTQNGISRRRDARSRA